jgi:DNA-binding NarL/FixJ family response regulator
MEGMPKAKPTTRSRGEADLLLNELVMIRKLLVYALLRTGASQKQIGAAIGISQSSISRMFPDVATKIGAKSIDDNTVQGEGS